MSKAKVTLVRKTSAQKNLEEVVKCNDWNVSDNPGFNDDYNNISNNSTHNRDVSSSSTNKDYLKLFNGKSKKQSRKRIRSDPEENLGVATNIDKSGPYGSKKPCPNSENLAEKLREDKMSNERGNQTDSDNRLKCDKGVDDNGEENSEGTKNSDVEFIVRPSQHSLLQRSRGKRKRLPHHKNSSSNSPTAKPSEKVPLYQKIDKDCYVAVDCEMVGVGSGGGRSVLGRCSIVSYSGKVLYDKYIRPQEPITNFRTIYSGITPQHMDTAEKWEKAKQDIHNLLKNKVIIGHDVRNDFKVMHFNPHHCLVRDTSRCQMLSGLARKNGYEGSENGLVPLKSLAKTLLGKDIQVGTNGHDSVEDARATLELFLRVRNGWEKLLFMKWHGEGLSVTEMVNGLNQKQDVCDGNGLRITDFSTDKNTNSNVGGGAGAGQQCSQEDYLSDDFWPAM